MALARRYAATRPAMIVLGGSSMHKGANGWQAGRAIACLPALTGNVGIPGGGFGPRHGSAAHGRGLNITELGRRRAGTAMPEPDVRGSRQHCATVASGRCCCWVPNMLSSFADAGERRSRDSRRTPLVVSYDLFLNDTARRFADVVLPGTAWLEELGCKMTHTHLYLMERAWSRPARRARSTWVTELAERLGLTGFYPWAIEEALIDAILDHPCTGHATVAALRAEGGIRALDVSHVANPTLDFDDAVAQDRALLGASAASRSAAAASRTRSVPGARRDDGDYALALGTGRTLTHFHGFYNNGRELPTLARRNPSPRCGFPQLTHRRAMSRMARRSASSTSAASCGRERA